MKIALTGALLASALVLPLAVTAGDFSPYVDTVSYTHLTLPTTPYV